MATDIFKDNWSKYFSKNNAACVINGKTAIHRALELLKSRVVAIPTYTCHRVYEAAINAQCKPIIIDCDYDLQIKIEELAKYDDIDTVIVPHMFGITALEEMKLIKKMGYKIIEDCSQCMGTADLGRYSDIVIASLGPTTLIHRSNVMFMEIEERISRRTERVNELRNAGLRFIGQERPNAWHRAMYYTENQKRVPYTPLHDRYEGFKCPLIDSIKNKIDWISVFPN